MSISGFTMVKNADTLYYPIKESILSALPICDEFVVALGDCLEGDKTEELIKSINSDKIKIVHTVWDLNQYPNGTENAHQTDIAKNLCKGDWLLYLQADEVLHETDLPKIKRRCEELLNDNEVEGLLFKYYHFWGDYAHVHNSHTWYKNEIRIVRNHPEIHSWESAQSFRKIPGFDGKNYRQQKGTFKLKVARVDAHIYHYGWVRPPQLMQKKKKALDTIHKGENRANDLYKNQNLEFDYGPLGKIPFFKGTHPAVMADKINSLFWTELLNQSVLEIKPNRKAHKHERLKYKVVSFLENTFLSPYKTIGGFKNYLLLNK